MVAQTAEWVQRRDNFLFQRSDCDGNAGKLLSRNDQAHNKIGPIKGIAVGLLMGVFCWGFIITAIVYLR